VIRVGIVGLGRMGEIRAGELRRHPETELVSGFDPDAARFDLFPGVQRCSSAAEVIESDIDAVFVCTPNAATADAVVAALDGGKHVFCEKPPGRSLADVHRMMEAERRNPSLKLQFGFNHRYHSGVQEAKRVIDSGRLGKLLWMRGVYGKAGGPGFEQSWRNSREVGGGGILLDQGIHMLDLMRYFAGDFAEVKSMVSTSHWPVDVEDNAFALLRTAEGTVAMIHSSSTQWKHRFLLEAYLSDGFVSINGILSSTRSYGDETITVAQRREGEASAMGKPREEIIYFDRDPSWELEVAHFVDCIQGDNAVQFGTTEDALKAMEMVFSIYAADGSRHNPYHDVLEAESPAIYPAAKRRKAPPGARPSQRPEVA
jgi:predicted dehydrogenase